MTRESKWMRAVLVTLVGLALAGTSVCARAETAKKETTKAAGQTVEMKVTDKGFEPASVTVKKGEPVTLVITRMTAKTCATEIVIDEHGINTKLPLNKAVKVTFTPTKTGELQYGCAMNKMIGGVLTVQ